MTLHAVFGDIFKISKLYTEKKKIFLLSMFVLFCSTNNKYLKNQYM